MPHAERHRYAGQELLMASRFQIFSEDVEAGDPGAVGGAVGAEGFFVAEDLVGDEGEADGKLREG